MTEEKWNALEELYEALCRVITMCNVRYCYEDDEYYADFNADRECIASIENAHADLGFLLGREV